MPSFRESTRHVSPSTARFALLAAPTMGVIFSLLGAMLFIGLALVEALAHPHSRPFDAGSFVYLGFVGILAAFAGVVGARKLWARRRELHSLLAEPAEERSFVRWAPRSRLRALGLEAHEGQSGPAWIPLVLEPNMNMGLEEEGRRAVRVRGLAGRRVLIETEAGWLSLATRAGASAPPPPDDIPERHPLPGVVPEGEGSGGR